MQIAVLESASPETQVNFLCSVLLFFKVLYASLERYAFSQQKLTAHVTVRTGLKTGATLFSAKVDFI